jgi:hypothetical protein
MQQAEKLHPLSKNVPGQPAGKPPQRSGENQDRRPATGESPGRRRPVRQSPNHIQMSATSPSSHNIGGEYRFGDFIVEQQTVPVPRTVDSHFRSGKIGNRLDIFGFPFAAECLVPLAEIDKTGSRSSFFGKVKVVFVFILKQMANADMTSPGGL